MSRAGEVVREARRRASLSQAELARRSGISRPTVNAYEKGRREPGFEALARLLRVTGHRLVLADAPPYPDEQAAARDLEDLLGLADAIRVARRAEPLRFPSFVRR